ncbi:hypothetical protein NDU88_001490 [Pleurodeles waltl]|uniref:Uncharacterized protein n=1 Tax=Pleurodeles waltl TaxID=8319 RepID=A0AAV7WIL1_PLEWA|nr:hypothetical protein NDU88_001490 [Pleurodeles waltl]
MEGSLCIALPRYMAKPYPLEELLDSVNVDSVVASLVGRSYMAEEKILKDGADKKDDSSMKKAYAGANLALRAGVYGAYVSQSLFSDFETLVSTIR